MLLLLMMTMMVTMIAERRVRQHPVLCRQVPVSYRHPRLTGPVYALVHPHLP